MPAKPRVPASAAAARTDTSRPFSNVGVWFMSVTYRVACVICRATTLMAEIGAKCAVGRRVRAGARS